MNAFQWVQYQTFAENLLREQAGSLQITDVHSRIITLWCREAIEKQRPPDATAIHLAIFSELPPPNFGQVTSVRDFIIEAHRVYRWGDLSTEQIEQLDCLAFLIASLGTEGLKAASSKSSKGCLGVVLIFLVPCFAASLFLLGKIQSLF